MSDLHSAIESGHYAQKQIFSRDKLIAWSHARRFDTAVSLARQFRGRRVLDYGCGDGTFLALTMMSAHPPVAGVGAELLELHVEDCQRRYRDEPSLQFVAVQELDRREHAGRYDGLFCMEVLEHVVDWKPLLERFERLLAPGGRLVISVPVETGVPVLIKQTVRRIAGWRKIGHYPGTTSYSWPEMIGSVLAGPTQHLERPVFDTGNGPFHDHKGFNWMVLRARLAKRFEIEQVIATPYAWLGPALATQVWFVAHRR